MGTRLLGASLPGAQRLACNEARSRGIGRNIARSVKGENFLSSKKRTVVRVLSPKRVLSKLPSRAFCAEHFEPMHF